MSETRQSSADGARTVAAVPTDLHPAPVRPAEQVQPNDYLRLALPGLIWGTSFFFIAEGLDAFPAAMITPTRIAFGFVTLACFRAARVSTIRRADQVRIALLAVVWMAFPLSMFPIAEDGRVSSSVTGMLNGATPFFVAGVAAFIARRPPPRAQIGGLFVGLAGIVLISLPTLGEGRSSTVGVLLILAALLSYGVALNLAIPLQRRYGSLPVIWRAQGAALLMTAPFGVTHLDEVEFAWWPLVAVALLGVFGTALAYVLAADNAGRYGPTKTSITTYLIPVVALFLGAVVLDEQIAALSVIGCGVALLGAYLVARIRDSTV